MDQHDRAERAFLERRMRKQGLSHAWVQFHLDRDMEKAAKLALTEQGGRKTSVMFRLAFNCEKSDNSVSYRCKRHGGKLGWAWDKIEDRNCKRLQRNVATCFVGPKQPKKYVRVGKSASETVKATASDRQNRERITLSTWGREATVATMDINWGEMD